MDLYGAPYEEEIADLGERWEIHIEEFMERYSERFSKWVDQKIEQFVAHWFPGRDIRKAGVYHGSLVVVLDDGTGVGSACLTGRWNESTGDWDSEWEQARSSWVRFDGLVAGAEQGDPFLCYYESKYTYTAKEEL